MDMIHEPRTARKILLLKDSQKEALVITSRTSFESWSESLILALESCAQRGIKIFLLVEGSGFRSSPRAARLQLAGAKIRFHSNILPWLPTRGSLRGEIWLFDRNCALTGDRFLGREIATGAAAYFDLRWQSSSAAPVAFSVRHKNYSFHIGPESEQEFFACLLSARREIILSLASSRISRKVESALRQALSRQVSVTIYVSAEREDAPALKRLRRIAASGALLKICGRQLSSECVLVDNSLAYMGSLPRSWNPLSAELSPSFLVQNHLVCGEILQELESLVSVEIRVPTSPSLFPMR